MVRFLIGIVVALGLVFAPTAGEARAVLAGGGSDCAMGGAMPDMPDMPSSHSKMACCTIVCQAPTSLALLSMKAPAIPFELVDRSTLSQGPGKRLLSFISSTLDPPPRS